MRLAHRIAVGVAAVGVALSGTYALGAGPALADTSATVSGGVSTMSVVWIPLKQGDHGFRVEGVRCFLAQQGYAVKCAANGGSHRYDSALTSAVKKYQQNSHLDVTGRVGDQTWERISDDVGTVEKGDKRKTLVRGLQYALNAQNKNYPDIAVDGVFGAGTKRSVEHFQRSVGYTPDGVVGPDTLISLYGH